MTQQFDTVQNPKHYTTHPSGIECEEISSMLCSPLGQAFQYVFRRKQKGTEKQDLEKAVWWLKQKIEDIENCPEHCISQYVNLPEDVDSKLNVLVTSEYGDSESVMDFYWQLNLAIMSLCTASEKRAITYLNVCVSLLEYEILNIESN